MKIAHVLTYVSRDAAYGGPLAVASAHCAQLALRGHDVELFAGWDGVAEIDVAGVRPRLYRVRRLAGNGFSGLVAPRLVIDLLRRSRSLDVVHVHLARDLVTLAAAWALTLVPRGPRLYVQTHGMIKPDSRLAARLVDIAVRRVLARASCVFALHDEEAAGLRKVARAGMALQTLPNGVPLRAGRRRAQRAVPEVVFMARLHPRKRVLAFAEAARLVLAAGASAHFVVIGPDEGELEPLLAFIARNGLDDHLVYEGSVPPGAGPERLARSDVYVLPSRREPFPMTVLEALSVGTPSVISSDCQVSGRLLEHGGVEVFDGDAEELAAVLQVLLDDPRRRAQLGQEGLRSIESTFGIEAVVELLERLYRGDARHADDKRKAAAA